MSKLIALVVLCAVIFEQAHGLKSLRGLRRDLLDGYDRNVRPVRRFHTQMPVTVSITPLSIRKLDTRDQVIVLDSWIMMRWKDEFLQWDPVEYDNITVLRLPAEDVWKPDLALYTATPDTGLFPKTLTGVLAYSSGDVLWVPPFTISSRCPRSVKNSLLDKSFVECNIKFGSWTFSGPLLDLQLSSEKVDLTNFADFNPDWKLVKAVVGRESKIYPCCTEEYPSINFNITLKRRSSPTWNN